jgi:hypothetical protein
MKSVVAFALVCGCLGSSAAWAIDCLSSPGDPKTGYYSWRQIDGRKCWFRKTGAMPAKSQLHWPEKVEQEARPEEPASPAPSEPPASATQERTGSIAPPPRADVTMRPEARQPAPPRFKMVRVKPATGATLRLGHGFDLLSGVSLTGMQPFGARREPAGRAPADPFGARFTGGAD